MLLTYLQQTIYSYIIYQYQNKINSKWRIIIKLQVKTLASMQHQLENDIIKHIDDSPNNFALFLQKLTHDPTTITVLVHILQKQQRSVQLSQKLATSINFIVQQQFKQNDKNPQLWTHYVRSVACNNNIQWRIAKIFQRSITTFMQSFEDQLDTVMNDLYSKFADHHIIMTANSIINGCQFTPNNRFDFIKKSLAQYIKLGRKILDQCFEYQSRNTVIDQQILVNRFLRDYALEYLLTIKQILYFLKINANPQTEWEKLLNQASVDENLFLMIEGYVNMGKTIEKSQYFTLDGSVIKKEAFNNIKAVALQNYVCLLDRYHKRCTLEQFDQFPVLRFLQNQLPKVIEQMATIRAPILQLQCNAILGMSILKFIRKACEFVFMNNYFWDHYRFLYWKIVYPLLQISDEQIRQYNDDPQGFIRQAESLVEQFEDSQNIIKNCKTEASLLLEEITTHIDGSMTYIVIQCLLSLKDGVQHNKIESQGSIKFNAQIKIQQCFTILSILTLKIRKNRQDLIMKIRQFFHKEEHWLLQLKDIDKVRLLLYLVYTYQDIYPLQDEGKKLFYLAADCFIMKEIQVKAAIGFFKQYRDLEVAAIVWDRLIDLIQTTEYSQILGLVAEVTRVRVSDFSHDLIMTILNKSMGRIKTDFNNQMRQSNKQNNYQLANKSSVLQCLRTVKYICRQTEQRQQNQQIRATIWQLFDLMSGFSIIEYDDEVIEIFNIILKQTNRQINGDYFQYLDDFKKYHIKQKAVGALFETYFYMIQFGKQYLKSDRGKDSLTKIITNILIVVDLCIESSISDALLLLQYMVVVFPSQIDHKALFDRTYQSYVVMYKQAQLQDTVHIIYLKKHHHDKNLSYFINLWVLGSAVQEQVYKIGQRIILDTKINIFRNYSSKILGYAISSKIKVLIERRMLQQIVSYLIVGIRLLDHQDKYKQKVASKTQLMIRLFNQKDVFQQIRLCFKNCKQNLQTQDYEYVMKQIQKQVPLNVLKQLLSNYKVNYETRKIIRIASK